MDYVEELFSKVNGYRWSTGITMDSWLQLKNDIDDVDSVQYHNELTRQYKEEFDGWLLHV